MASTRDKVRSAVEQLNGALHELASEGVVCELSDVTAIARLQGAGIEPGSAERYRTHYKALRILAWHETER